MLISPRANRRLLGPWALLVSCLCAVVPAAGAEFADSSLAVAVAEAAGNPVEGLTGADLLAMTQLVARECGITDLAGIEQLVNLQVLDLARNQIRDLAPLTGLTQLEYLDLEGNAVSDLSPLSGLEQLELLILNGNEVGDLSPLLVLPQLATVELLGNPLDPATAPGDVATLQSRGAEVLWSAIPTAPDSLRWEFLGPVAPEPRAARVKDLAISPADPERVHAVAGDRVKLSRDGGASWVDAGTKGEARSVLLDPQRPLVAYVSNSWGPYPSFEKTKGAALLRPPLAQWNVRCNVARWAWYWW